MSQEGSLSSDGLLNSHHWYTLKDMSLILAYYRIDKLLVPLDHAFDPFYPNQRGICLLNPITIDKLFECLQEGLIENPDSPLPGLKSLIIPLIEAKHYIILRIMISRPPIITSTTTSSSSSSSLLNVDVLYDDPYGRIPTEQNHIFLELRKLPVFQDFSFQNKSFLQHRHLSFSNCGPISAKNIEDYLSDPLISNDHFCRFPVNHYTISRWVSSSGLLEQQVNGIRRQHRDFVERVKENVQSSYFSLQYKVPIHSRYFPVQDPCSTTTATAESLPAGNDPNELFIQNLHLQQATLDSLMEAQLSSEDLEELRMLVDNLSRNFRRNIDEIVLIALKVLREPGNLILSPGVSVAKQMDHEINSLAAAGQIMKNELYTGYSWSEARESYGFVDKTACIKEFLSSKITCMILTRPRRFGKTLLLSMLTTFLAAGFDGKGNIVVGDNRHLFAGCEIEKETQLMDRQGKNIVIHLDLLNCVSDSYEDFVDSFRTMINSLLTDQFPFLAEKLPDQKKNSPYLTPSTCPEETLKSSLSLFLIDLHKLYPTVPVFILVDEYDSIHKLGASTEDHSKIKDFLSTFFARTFKVTSTQKKYERALMVGSLTFSAYGTRNSFNNYTNLSVTHEVLSTSCGFTELEVSRLLEKFNLSKKLQIGIKAYFNGYNIGGTTIYNPFSVISFFIERRFTGSSSTLVNDLRSLTIDSLNVNLGFLRGLIQDWNSDPLSLKVTKNFSSLNFTDSPLDYYSGYFPLIMAHYGYLSLYEDSYGGCFVRVCNEELAIVIMNDVIKLFSNIQVSMKGKLEDFEQYIQHLNDYFGKRRKEFNAVVEQLFHIIIAFKCIEGDRDRYGILSEYQTGFGIADSVFLPRATADASAVIVHEYKFIDVDPKSEPTESAEKLPEERKAEAALWQIFIRAYASEPLNMINRFPNTFGKQYQSFILRGIVGYQKLGNLSVLYHELKYSTEQMMILNDFFVNKINREYAGKLDSNLMAIIFKAIMENYGSIKTYLDQVANTPDAVSNLPSFAEEIEICQSAQQTKTKSKTVAKRSREISATDIDIDSLLKMSEEEVKKRHYFSDLKSFAGTYGLDTKGVTSYSHIIPMLRDYFEAKKSHQLAEAEETTEMEESVYEEGHKSE